MSTSHRHRPRSASAAGRRSPAGAPSAARSRSRSATHASTGVNRSPVVVLHPVVARLDGVEDRGAEREDARPVAGGRVGRARRGEPVEVAGDAARSAPLARGARDDVCHLALHRPRVERAGAGRGHRDEVLELGVPRDHLLDERHEVVPRRSFRSSPTGRVSANASGARSHVSRSAATCLLWPPSPTGQSHSASEMPRASNVTWRRYGSGVDRRTRRGACGPAAAVADGALRGVAPPAVVGRRTDAAAHIVLGEGGDRIHQPGRGQAWEITPRRRSAPSARRPPRPC